MAITEHFAALSQYGASAVRIVPTTGEAQDQLGDGGSLQENFEAFGQGTLFGVLSNASVRAVLLSDGDLSIEATRDGTSGRLVVKWGDKVAINELVPLPGIRSAAGGPWFRPAPESEFSDLESAVKDASAPIYVVTDGQDLRCFGRGTHGDGVGRMLLKATVPAVRPAELGAQSFREAHGVRWSYVAGAMAGGIASADLVLAMAKDGLLGFFGAGGLPLQAVEESVQRIANEVPADAAWGCNLLNNPNEPEVEEKTVDLYLKYGVKKISASAYMGLSAAVVRYRLSGIHRDAEGRICCPNSVFAKVSRPEVAEKFLRPATEEILTQLQASGALNAEQVAMARQIPVAEDITAEADSGGHTDRRALPVLLPVIQRLRDQIAREQGYAVRPRVGAAGGIGTPAAVWGAYAMGADYVLTGSINQATLEAGTSDVVKAMLAEASFFDVATGPAPDMFEIGAHVQVLSRGTMYARRAQRLYEVYKTYASMDAIPEAERKKLERQIFRRPLAEVWQGTAEYWSGRDPEQVARAERDGRHQMALTFRWYLGMTSRWARMGEDDRKRDFQIWCGPSMGGFNDWAEGTALEAATARTVTGVAAAMMEGAAVEARRSLCRTLLGAVG
jgi:trans-AT polyketide synthase, acyltransferase and oxidoreductase domains